jgi:mannose/fructose/N-acetylgalactosamine-specific phosphotransferase system component IIB
MSVVLVRVDQRLLHGQVAVGWAPSLDADHVLIADDVLAADAFGREVMTSAAPPELKVDVVTLREAAQRFGELPGRTMLLVRHPAALLELVRQGAAVQEANVGGLHWKEGTRRFLDYLYVTPEDVTALSELARLGVRLTARDLPGNPKVDLVAALADGRLVFDHLPARHP